MTSLNIKKGKHRADRECAYLLAQYVELMLSQARQNNIPDWPGWQTTALFLPVAAGFLLRLLFGASFSFAARRSLLPAPAELLGLALLTEGLEGCALKKLFGCSAGFGAAIKLGACCSASWSALGMTS